MASAESMSVEADVEQLLTGLQVGLNGARGTCCCCGRELYDGHWVTVYAYRTAGHERWNLPRIYCRGCGKDRVETPTLGTTEVVATAFLGLMQLAASQTSRLALTRVELEAWSPADEGSGA